MLGCWLIGSCSSSMSVYILVKATACGCNTSYSEEEFWTRLPKSKLQWAGYICRIGGKGMRWNGDWRNFLDSGHSEDQEGYGE
jgi:hypothetical protein